MLINGEQGSSHVQDIPGQAKDTTLQSFDFHRRLGKSLSPVFEKLESGVLDGSLTPREQVSLSHRCCIHLSQHQPPFSLDWLIQ